MVDERTMELALAEMNAELEPNATAISKNWGLERTTLKKRWLGQTTSRATYLSERRQRLTNEQEEQLIYQINRLTDRGMPPTSQMIKNFAKEIIGDKVRKNWIGQFVQRHQRELKSLYLRNIDNLRVKGEYPLTYKLFF
jgi:hypothetical protein